MKSLVAYILDTVSIHKEDAEEIARNFHQVYLKRGDLILEPGQVSDDYIYLQKGLMRSYLYDLEGNEITTDFYTSNNVAFEVTSFFNRSESQAFLEAVVDCDAFRISYQELNSLFHKRSACREFGRAVLVKEFIRSQKRNYSMINRSAQQRYQELIATRPEVMQYAPLKQIASFLGITDSSLSRLRRETK